MRLIVMCVNLLRNCHTKTSDEGEKGEKVSVRKIRTLSDFNQTVISSAKFSPSS